MKKKAHNWRWFIPLLIFVLFVVACSSETPVAEQPLPEQPEATATSAPVEEVPTAVPEAPPETPEPETDPEVEAPEISQPIARWNAVNEQGNWVLVGYGDALNPVVVEPGTYVTINFSAIDDQVNGSGGCNNFFTNYTADDEGNLTINAPVGTTQMACERGMEQEALFLGALETVSGYTVTEQGHLLLDYDSGTVYDEQLVFFAETPLINTTWVLTAYGQPNNLTPAEDGVATTAVFSSDGTLKGFGGCNNFTAEYQIQENQISISLPSTTLSLCEKGMDQEQAFILLLGAAQTYRLMGNELEISAADGTNVLHFSTQHLPLENVRWLLDSINGRPLPDGVSANALFTPAGSPAAQGQENSVTGSAGCNTFFGAYTLAGDTLTAGPIGLTQMMCEELVMQVEQAFLAGLENIQGYQVIGNQLTIYTSTGVLLFYADRMLLEGPKWIMTGSGAVDNPQPPSGGAIFTATFERQFGTPSGVKSGETGCNSYTATYYAGADEIKVNLPQTSRITCSDAQTEAEQGYFLGLNAARDYRILGSELYVYYDAYVLIFVGSYPPTAESSLSETGPLTPLDGTQWWLTSIDTAQVLPGSEVTLRFDIEAGGRTGRISGSGGCNNYNADIADVFILWPINVTSASCDTPAGVMDQETAYLSALQKATSLQFHGETLQIITDQKILYFANVGPKPTQPQPTPGVPTAVINAPRHIHVGQTVTFSGERSSSGAAITSYRWWFTGDITAEGVTVKQTYNKLGTFDAILTITDADGESAEASMKVNVHVPLVGSTWIMDGSNITLNFGDGVLSGNTGCNDYTANYTASLAPGGNQDMAVSSLAATGQTCGEEVMEKEQIFLTNLQLVTSYRIDYDHLTLIYPEGTMTFYKP
jgi:heat shock protein HslJ